MTKKRILLDLRNLSNPTSGFGQIALNYARHFNQLETDDMAFVLLIPESFSMDEGGRAEIVRYSKAMRKDKSKLPSVDLWHSVNQQQKVRRIDGHTKFVLTIHDLNYLTEKNWIRQLKHNLILGNLIRKASAVTAISGFVARQVESRFAGKLGGKPVEVVYDAVEKISGRPQRRPAFAQERPFFFTIGQVRRKKNFHLLVEVMKAFPDHNLYICGDDHFDGATLVRNKIKETGVGNVTLTGKISEEEKNWLYAHCEAFLFPSQGEGFGLPVVEAMQFGKPVFVSPFTCLPEIAGGHAFVWSDVKTETMIEGIRQFLPTFHANPALAENMVHHALSFSYESHVAKYVELYRRILKDEDR